MAPEATDSDGASARDTVRILLVACCLLALVLAGMLVPSLTGGAGGSPAESLVPGTALSSEGSAGSGLSPEALGSLGRSGFGALNPSRSTDVGGSTGVEGPNPYRSQDNAVHFTVTSPRPAYWRTAAYDRYTGAGWRQSGGAVPLDGPIEGEGIQGPRVEYEVTLNRSATALPTVWRPRTVRDRSGLFVTDQRAIRTEQAFGPGERYVGVSHRPPQDTALLRAAGTDYPADVERRYTDLPTDVPARVGQFTDELTRNASTPYETAVTIEQWLEADKTYSLNVSRTSDSMADTFIFDMDRGYCEYFATSMVVMLRTQDIPARYTVGYSTGQQAGDTYTVRAMNAHAWVEVYFEDVGWVKFDPTPGSARLRTEQRSLAEQSPNEEYTPREEGSPGESFTPDGETAERTPTATPAPGETPTDGSDGTDADSEDDGTTGRTDSGYDISLNRTAVPGTAVAVSVSRGGSPAVGVTVLFNGDPVGTTDERGTVIATVPYTRELRVDVADGPTASLTAAGARALPADTDRFHRLPPPSSGAAEVTIPVETNATVTVSGDVVPGATVTVTATVADIPIEGAAVRVDGRQVATTGDSGRATVALPERPGNVTIAVERDPIAGSRTLTLPSLNVSVAPDAPLALPLTTATVTVTAGGNPVSSVPVLRDGHRVATTGVDGTATVGLPLASRTTLTASAFGLTGEATVSGLFANLGLALAGLVLAVAVPLGVAARRGYAPRDVLALLRRLPRLSLRAAQWLLVTLATRGDELLALLAARLRRTAAHLAALLRGRVTPAELWAALLAWLTAKRRTVGHRVGRGEPPEERPAEATPTEARRTVRAAWARFLDYVSLRRHRTKTPGEIARHAVDRDGLPAEPVARLRDAFREVEYGARSASERLEGVEEALAAIERERADGAEEPPDGTDENGPRGAE